jgi:hypothetical protein
MSEPVRDVARELFMIALGTVGQDFSSMPLAEDEIDTYASAMADMFCAADLLSSSTIRSTGSST